VKQLARKSALNSRAADGNLYVVERFEQQSPKTRELLALLEKLGVSERKVLILTHGVSEAVYLSARNLPRVDVLPFGDAGAYDVLWAEVVLVEQPALAGEPVQPVVRTFVPLPKTIPAPRAPRPKTEPKPKAEKPAKPVKTAKAAKAAKAKADTKTAPKAEKKAAPKAKRAAKKPAVKKPGPKKKGGK
jgi:hypothetical protein